jgi:hypothetical protein
MTTMELVREDFDKKPIGTGSFQARPIFTRTDNDRVGLALK